MHAETDVIFAGNDIPRAIVVPATTVITISEGAKLDDVASALTLWSRSTSNFSWQQSWGFHADVALFIAGTHDGTGLRNYGGAIVKIADITFGTNRRAEDGHPATLEAARVDVCARITLDLKRIKEITQTAVCECGGLKAGTPLHLFAVHMPRGNGLLQELDMTRRMVAALPYWQGTRFILSAPPGSDGAKLFSFYPGPDKTLNHIVDITYTGKTTAPEPACDGTRVVSIMAARQAREARRTLTGG